MEQKAQELADLFKLLSNKNRLMIVCALIDGPCTVAQIAEHIPGISQPALSQHLAALRHARVVQGDKQGQYVVYRLVEPRLVELFELLRSRWCD